MILSAFPCAAASQVLSPRLVESLDLFQLVITFRVVLVGRAHPINHQRDPAGRQHPHQHRRARPRQSRDNDDWVFESLAPK